VTDSVRDLLAAMHLLYQPDDVDSRHRGGYRERQE